MRISEKAFLSCAVLAGVLLGAMGAMADDTCNTTNGFSLKAEGPTPVTCSTDPSSTCTQIKYTITKVSGNADHVAVLVRTALPHPMVVEPVGVSVTTSAFCGGDSTIGVRDGVLCHETILDINNNFAKNSFFTVQVDGARGPLTTSVIVKNGANKQGACEIVGFGIDPAVEAAPVTEIIKEPSSSCAVEFTLDRITGKVLHAQLTDDSAGCDFYDAPVESLKLSLKGLYCAHPLGDGSCPIGDAKFGEGYVHSGTGSCTTRVIGGRVYTWGSPCPE
jgi:hypothetical protein